MAMAMVVVVVHLIPHSTTTTISISGTSFPPCFASSACHRSQECGNIDKNKERKRESQLGEAAHVGQKRGGRGVPLKPSSTRARLLAPKETQNRNPKQKLRSANSAEYFIISLLALFITTTTTTTTRRTTIGQKPKHNLNKFRKISSNWGREKGGVERGVSVARTCQSSIKLEASS